MGLCHTSLHRSVVNFNAIISGILSVDQKCLLCYIRILPSTNACLLSTYNKIKAMLKYGSCKKYSRPELMVLNILKSHVLIQLVLKDHWITPHVL